MSKPFSFCRNPTPKLRTARMPDGAPLDFAPNNEQGVIFLFSHLARRRFGLRIESIQAGFPDCTAYLNGKRVRIEFEFRAKNFLTHKHNPKGCEWIVCWINNWPGAPKSLKIIELREEYGLGFNVWFQPAKGEYADLITTISASDQWSVPSQAMKGDLLLFYRSKPHRSVQDIFRVAGPVGYVKAGFKPGKDYMAAIRRVCRLKAPLHLEEFRQNKILRHAGFVRGQMQGRYRASEYWPELHRMITARNPESKLPLKKYGPARLE